jgi:hypothetical protein
VFPLKLQDYLKFPILTHRISSSLYRCLVLKVHCIKNYHEAAAKISYFDPSTCACNMPTVMPLYFRIFRLSRVAILHTCIYLVTAIFKFLYLYYFLLICKVDKDVQKVKQFAWEGNVWILRLRNQLEFFPLPCIAIAIFLYVFPISEINIL